jgi:hypothetical protein
VTSRAWTEMSSHVQRSQITQFSNKML